MEKKNHLHVVMLPWSAFGHMIPFFQLSIELARAGVHVSFVSTLRNLRRLPKLPSDASPLVDLVGFPRPKIDQNLLPEDAEATVEIPFEKIQYLKIAYDLLQRPFKEFVSKALPDWLIIDFAAPWALDIASEYNIRVVYFSVFTAASWAFIGPPEYLMGDGQKKLRSSPESLTSPAPWFDFPTSVAFRRYEAVAFHPGIYGENASGISDAERLGGVLAGCNIFAFRSCPEFDGQYLDLWQKLVRQPVVPVGLLQPERPTRTSSAERREEDSWMSESFQWLDRKKPRSVVFVGFGSECKLSKEQIHEIAHGLELSNLPFLWALRKPTWALNGDEALLPEGFMERTSSRGIVCMGWVPQTEILAHPSIGGSLFHSGWGSVIETLQFGHCLVLLPLIIDQPLNARMLVEKGLAVEVARSEDGSFSADGIASALSFAMVSEEGRELRDKAREAAKIFGDHKSSQNNMAGFVKCLEKYR